VGNKQFPKIFFQNYLYGKFSFQITKKHTILKFMRINKFLFHGKSSLKTLLILMDMVFILL